MNCNEFEANIDRYLDGLLDADAWRRAKEHSAGCPACDTLVASYQQASTLLKTAVTDMVAAVDVSGLWASIEAQVKTVPRVTASHPAGVGLFDRLRDWMTPLRIGATVATAAAAVALLLASVGTETTPERVARNAARPRTKAVRIETMEVPAGYTVSTWARPRSRTHMISINPAPSYTVASVSR